MFQMYSPLYEKEDSTNIADTPEKRTLLDEDKSSISDVLAVVRIDGLQLRDASLELQKDKDVLQEKNNHYSRRMFFQASDYSSRETSKNIPMPARNKYACEEEGFYLSTETQNKINDMRYNDANSSESDEENMFKMDL